MIQATALRRGMLIKKDGELFSVFSAIHKTPGNLRGFVQARLRNLRNGSMGEYRFRSVDKRFHSTSMRWSICTKMGPITIS
jgi:elongation factor P